MRRLPLVVLGILLAACAAPQPPAYLHRELEATQSAAELERSFNSEMHVTHHTLVLPNYGDTEGESPIAIVRLEGDPTHRVPFTIDTALVLFGGPHDPGFWLISPPDNMLTIARPADELDTFLASLDAADSTIVRLRGDRNGALFTEIRSQ